VGWYIWGYVLKFCKKCCCEKSLSEFYKHSGTKDGVKTICKSCDNKRKSIYVEKNIESVAETKAKYRERTKEKWSVYLSQWRKENTHKVCSYSSKRRSLLIGATPVWADKDKIENIYQQAALMNKNSTKVRYEVDHIIPLNNRLVCGLHTHENMQILQVNQNRAKKNFFQIEGAL
jgi:hypothetical protein